MERCGDLVGNEGGVGRARVRQRRFVYPLQLVASTVTPFALNEVTSAQLTFVDRRSASSRPLNPAYQQGEDVGEVGVGLQAESIQFREPGRIPAGRFDRPRPRLSS